MKNRRQMTPGVSGSPGTGGPAAGTARVPLRKPTDVGHGHGTSDIGRVGRTGHISS
jgi:hypothetical protein